MWLHPQDVSRSLFVGTNKAAAPDGAVVVFGLDGKIRQQITGIDRPNNVDIQQGFGDKDIAVATERLRSRLRVFTVNEAGLQEAGSIPVFVGEAGRQAAPMGIGLYKRPRDGAVFAIVSRKEGPATNYLWQYRLAWSADGKVTGEKVREFGQYAGTSEIEAVAVDDEEGFVYYADEDYGIRKYHADPDHPDAAKELAVLGRTGFQANREGIAIYAGRNGAGYVVCTDQLPGGSHYYLYRRRGDQSKPVTVLRGSADSTDGLDASAQIRTSQFPHGVLIAMNSRGKNFMLFAWPKTLAVR